MVNQKINKTAAWRALLAHHKSCRGKSISELFSSDRRRFSKFSLRVEDILFDYSKTTLTGETLKLLCDLAETAEVSSYRDLMFSGEKINKTECRAVTHTALRGDGSRFIKRDSDLMKSILKSREEMLSYVERCRGGRILSSDGGRYTDIIHIGIGGSHLGVLLLESSMRHYGGKFRCHYVTGGDGGKLEGLLKRLEASRTLVIMSSKTFKTEETLTHGTRVRDWLLRELGRGKLDKHIIATTCNVEEAERFGIKRIMSYPESVGGRYSVWGASGLLGALTMGRRHYMDFLEGAREMDEHFCDRSYEENVPVVLGLLGVWHRNFCGYGSRAVIPYDRRLKLLPSYIQQLDMESNGKTSEVSTSPVVFGSLGLESQHAYFQMLHQGTEIVPCEFVMVVGGEGRGRYEERCRRMELTSCIGQSSSLMKGRSSEEREKDISGGRPSLTLMLDELKPKTLGRLMSMYEHRTLVEGKIWGVNSFDQYGVELGKETSRRYMESWGEDLKREDSSTRGLLKHCLEVEKRLRKKN